MSRGRGNSWGMALKHCTCNFIINSVINHDASTKYTKRKNVNTRTEEHGLVIDLLPCLHGTSSMVGHPILSSISSSPSAFPDTKTNVRPPVSFWNQMCDSWTSVNNKKWRGRSFKDIFEVYTSHALTKCLFPRLSSLFTFDHLNFTSTRSLLDHSFC